MTLEVRLRPEAEQDLSDAAAWYEEQLPGLGHQFLDEVLAALSSYYGSAAHVPGYSQKRAARVDSSLSIRVLRL